MKTRLTILLIWMALLAGCQPSKSAGERWITVTEATSQSWAGGAYGSGHGVNYSFLVAFRKGSADEYNFDLIYADRRSFEPSVEPQGDGVLLRCAQVTRPKRSPEGDILEGAYEEEPMPAVTYPQFEGTAMIVGRRNGERFTLVVNTINRLQPLNYP